MRRCTTNQPTRGPNLVPRKAETDRPERLGPTRTEMQDHRAGRLYRGERVIPQVRRQPSGGLALFHNGKE